MSLRTWICIYWDRRWATFAVEVEDKVGVVARSLEEEGVRREEYRAVVMPPVEILYSRPLGRSPCIRYYKQKDMPPVVLTPLGMSGVELVQDMMVGEEGREQGREQGCTLGEEVEAAVEVEVEEEEEGEGEECCE